MLTEDCKILENTQLGPGIYKLVLLSGKIAPQVAPGQFVHLQISGRAEHILRRPFSVYDISADKTELSIVYQVVGQGTDLISQLIPNTSVNLLGPCGNGWQPPKRIENVLLVGGGIGAAPLFLLTKLLSASANVNIDLVLGAANASMLVFEDDYQKILAKDNIQICTDDGSAGTKGFTTNLAGELLQTKHYDYAACCGPEPMQAKLAQLFKQHNVSAEVSLEQRMACAVGACLSCKVNTKTGSKRACLDGPVFDAQEVIWA